MDERKTYDTQEVLKLCQQIDTEVEADNITKIFRIGKKVEGKPRPLLFGLKDLQMKIGILRKKKDLKDEYANVKILSDCTPEQRKHDHQVYLEMKEKNEKNEDDGFLYILVGRPGERRMRRVKKRAI